MGGNAFENTVRMQNRQEFEQVYQAQQELFAPIGLLMTMPMQIKSKDSIDYVDIIIPTGYAPKIREILERYRLDYNGNGIVTSYLTKGNYQINLIAIRPNLIDYATNYFAYGECGNILGQMIKKHFHLKNSFNGLYYVYQQDTGNYQKELLLSLEYKDLIDMLELDWSQFEQGFETNEHLFDWFYASPFLDTDAFKFENLNHTNRVRDRKRKFYHEWLKYLDGKPKKPTKTPKPLGEYFESFDKKYIQAEAEYSKHRAYKAKFNSNLAMFLTGLKGKPLGEFMALFVDEYTKDEILAMTDAELELNILSLYQHFQATPTPSDFT